MLTVIGFGLMVGLLLGALGAGGSVVTVPILVYALHEDVQTAAVTSLLIVAATAAVGAASHVRAGTVRLRTAIALSAVATSGSFAGSALRELLSGRAFLLAFAVLLAVVAALVWRSPREGSGAARECILRPGLRDCSRLAFAGLVVGLLTGFFGVGGGFVIVPTLMLVMGFPARDAVGTSLVVVSLASLLALVPSLRHGSIEWATAVPLAAGGAIGALLGARTSRRLPEVVVRRAFALALVGLAAFVVSRNVSGPPSASTKGKPSSTSSTAAGSPPCSLVASATPQAASGRCSMTTAPVQAPVCESKLCPTRRLR